MSYLPEKVTSGAACRFCEREFVDGTGNPIRYQTLTICSHCATLPGVTSLKYHQSAASVKEGADVWALRKSEILRELQSEVNEDQYAIQMMRQVKREQNKESFDERLLPKFKAWLGDDCFWDEKKCLVLK